MPPIVQRKPRKPPKLMHVLVPGEKRRVHDLAKENREDYLMDMDVPDDGTDYGDYTSKWEYLGNQVCSNYLKMYSFISTNLKSALTRTMAVLATTAP